MDGSNWRWDGNGSPGGQPEPPAPQPGESGPSPVIILLVAALLVGTGYVLIQQLGEISYIQNCALQGRTNCAPIDRAHPTAASGWRWNFGQSSSP